MPPLGSVLTDDQIAAVLTYVRRAWGNDGWPVTSQEVAQVRTAAAGRTRPWTNADLAGLGSGR
jgi:mono/diheme cytochrome c family protein